MESAQIRRPLGRLRMDIPGNCVLLNVDSAGAAGRHGQTVDGSRQSDKPPTI